MHLKPSILNTSKVIRFQDSLNIKNLSAKEIAFKEIIYKLIDWAFHECFKR